MRLSYMAERHHISFAYDGARIDDFESTDPSEERLGMGPGAGAGRDLFGVVLVIGTVGYMVIEGWSAWDAFYMTTISVTTVGYREVHELSWTGQAWTTLLLFAGVGTLFYTATTILGLVIEGGFAAHLKRRWFNRMLTSSWHSARPRSSRRWRMPPGVCG